MSHLKFHYNLTRLQLYTCPNDKGPPHFNTYITQTKFKDLLVLKWNRIRNKWLIIQIGMYYYINDFLGQYQIYERNNYTIDTVKQFAHVQTTFLVNEHCNLNLYLAEIALIEI